MKKWKTQRNMDGWMDRERRSVTNYGMTVQDNRDRDMWRNLAVGEGKPLYSGKSSDEFMNL
jgi:hypothetical protein